MYRIRDVLAWLVSTGRAANAAPEEKQT